MKSKAWSRARLHVGDNPGGRRFLKRHRARWARRRARQALASGQWEMLAPRERLPTGERELF